MKRKTGSVTTKVTTNLLMSLVVCQCCASLTGWQNAGEKSNLFPASASSVRRRRRGAGFDGGYSAFCRSEISVKKSKCSNIDEKRATEFAKQHPPNFVKAVLSAPLQTKQKTRRRKQHGNQQKNSVADQVYQELQQHGFTYAEARKSLNDLVLEPILKLAWTKTLEGYADARLSAQTAVQRIWAGTEAARAGLDGDPWLDVCLYKIRAGLLQGDNPEILRCMRHAQRIGKGQWFIEKTTTAFENAAKRVPGASEFSRLRVWLAGCWLRNGSWLMPDGLIARLAHVSREAIRKAVRELKLMKNPATARGAPIVKGLDTQGDFIFAEGYPPKN